MNFRMRLSPEPVIKFCEPSEGHYSDGTLDATLTDLQLVYDVGACNSWCVQDIGKKGPS